MKIAPAERIAQMQPYYFSRKLAEIRSMQQNGKEILNLGIGNPSDPPAESVVETLKTHASQPDIHGYQGYTGSPGLRSAFSHWMKRIFQVPLDPASQVLPSMGSKEAIMQLSMAFLNQGDAVLVPDPGYPSYTAATRMMQAEIVPYTLLQEKSWMPDFQELEQLVAQFPVKLMWVNYPHMPSGARASAEFFKKLVAFAQKHHILVIHDNPYALIRNNEPLSILKTPGAEKIALELHSLSKSHNMAGWRVGFITGASHLLSELMKVKSNMNTGSFLPVQHAAAEALKLGDWWYRQLNERYHKRAALAYHIMDETGCTYERNQAGMFVWGKIPEEMESAEALSNLLLYEAGVFLAPGFIFGENGKRYIRISISVSEDTLTKALEQIQTHIKQVL